METAKAVRIGRALAEADFVIIGTSNGFNMAEGLNLFCADAHFWETYGDLAQTDGIGSGMSSAAGFNHYNRAGMARDDTFLQGAAWRESLGRYERFVRERGYGCVLLLELGVGEMTPGIITLPFWSMAAKLPDAHLLSVNISGGSAPLQLGSKAEVIQADLGVLFSAARAGDE